MSALGSYKTVHWNKLDHTVGRLHLIFINVRKHTKTRVVDHTVLIKFLDFVPTKAFQFGEEKREGDVPGDF